MFIKDLPFSDSDKFWPDDNCSFELDKFLSLSATLFAIIDKTQWILWFPNRKYSLSRFNQIISIHNTILTNPYLFI